MNQVRCRDKFDMPKQRSEKSYQEAFWILFAVQVDLSKFQRDHLECDVHDSIHIAYAQCDFIYNIHNICFGR